MGEPAAEGGESALVVMAEQALLGALLWDPRRLREVAWLEPEDFARRSHQAIYQTLIGLAADRRPIDLLTLPTVLAQGTYHDWHVSDSARTPDTGALSAAALAHLLTMTPAPAPQAGTAQRSEHRRYAAIVLEESIRRQVATMGTRIEQASTPDTDHGQDTGTAQVRETSEAIGRVLAATAARLDTLTSQLTRASTPDTPTHASSPASAAQPALPSQRPPVPIITALPSDPAWAEAALVGACLTAPGLRQLATARLEPSDFTGPEAAATWAALRAATTAGDPVDFVLLAARLHRSGPHPDHGPGLPPDRLATLARRADIVSGHHALTVVTYTALLRAAGQARQLLAIVADAAHPSTEQLLVTTRAVLDRLDSTRRRLDAGTGQPPASAPAAPAARPARIDRPAPPSRRPAPVLHRPTPRTRPTGYRR